MSASLVIEPIPQRETLPDKKRDKLVERHGPLLPITPATAIIYGRIGSGKTSIMYSWLKNLFPRYYDEVVIFCGTGDSREAFEALPQKNILFLTDYDDESFTEYINKLREDQMERLEKGKRALNVCICFDDIVFSNAIAKGGRSGSMVERLMLVCRHELNATVLIACQHSKQITPAMRNNTLYHIICGVQRNDLMKIAEEHANHLTYDEFIAMYNHVHRQKHQFIVVDYKAAEEGRFRHNFDTIIQNPGHGLLQDSGEDDRKGSKAAKSRRGRKSSPAKREPEERK